MRSDASSAPGIEPHPPDVPATRPATITRRLPRDGAGRRRPGDTGIVPDTGVVDAIREHPGWAEA